ncbi:MAG: DNA repair exonuclease [Polyangiaceae bacterium]
MLIAHAADIHLDSPMLGLEAYEDCPREALREATRRALGRMIDTILDEHASLLLISGDLYDGAWKDYSTGHFFAAQMSKLRAADVRVVLLRGNHDAESQLAKNIRLPENVRELRTRQPETIEFSDLGVAIHGQGFATRAVTEDLARNYPAPRSSLVNIGMLHTALSGHEFHERYAPTTTEVLTGKGYDYWALGHIHRRQVVQRAPYIVFPGNLQGRHVRETGPKGFTLLTVEGGHVTQIEERAVDVVRWFDLEVAATADDSYATLLDRAGKELEQAARDAEGRLAAVRVTLAGRSRAHAELARRSNAVVEDLRALAVDVAERSMWIGEVRLSTRPLLDLQALERANDPLALLLRAVDAAATDATLAQELVGVLADLREKLPEDARKELAFFEDPKELGDLLPDVRDLLLSRLVTADDAADAEES